MDCMVVWHIEVVSGTGLSPNSVCFAILLNIKSQSFFITDIFSFVKHFIEKEYWLVFCIVLKPDIIT